MNEDHRTPVTMCWHCDRMLDAATEVNGSDKPTPGAISLCLYCGAVAIFGLNLELRAPTKEELDDLEKESEFIQQYIKFQWARQYVMLNHSLMRDRDDPDR